MEKTDVNSMEGKSAFSRFCEGFRNYATEIQGYLSGKIEDIKRDGNTTYLCVGKNPDQVTGQKIYPLVFDEENKETFNEKWE